MKIMLLDGYFIEDKSGNFTLKKEYPGKREGKEVMCEKIISHHQSFEDAAERFLRLYQCNRNGERLVSLKEYLNSIKEENRKAVEAIQISRMERFVMYVPKATGTEKEAHPIVDLIPVGRDNAIKREVLVALCVQNGLVKENLSPKGKDSATRILIKKARVDYTILNLSNGVGYYRVSKDDLQDLQDLQRYIRQEEKRAKSTFNNLSMAKKLYEDYRHGRL